MADTVAAVTNNATGVAGMAFNSKVLSIDGQRYAVTALRIIDAIRTPALPGSLRLARCEWDNAKSALRSREYRRSGMLASLSRYRTAEAECQPPSES